MKSLESRRPKPPPLRVTCSVMSGSGIPSSLDTAVLPPPGICVGDQISTFPFLMETVVFIGSSAEWLTNGIS